MVKFGWDKLKRFLAQSNSWTGQQTFSNINVTGGAVTGITDLAIADGGTGASTAATAFANLKQAATTSTSGVTIYSGTTKALAGTDTASAMTPADVAAKVAVDVNPKAMSQGVAMTYAASGSSGITVADNDNIDFGTGNFTLVWKGSLPDWTPSVDTGVITKWISGGTDYEFDATTSGKLACYIGTSTQRLSTTVHSLLDKTVHEITAVVVRETSGADGSVNFYVDGFLLGNAVTLPAGVPVALNSATPFMVCGYSVNRYASTTNFAATFNRALTAAEVLDLYRNGIAEADKWGSQTVKNVSACENSLAAPYETFDGASATGFHVVSDGTGFAAAGTADEIVFLLNKNYTAEFDYVKTSGLNPTMRADSGFLASQIAEQTVLSGDGHYIIKFTIKEAATGRIVFYNNSTASEYTISNLSIKETGATLALEPEGIQPAPGQWLDSSSNKLHAMQPAAGSSLTRPKKDFEYRWTNTWTASSAAQYVGGLNQAVLSADHFITDIITQATETTGVENLELGDGSAVAKFVAAFTPSATRTKQTVAAQNDGTNLKLVYTPAAAATMTVETIIRGFIWEP